MAKSTPRASLTRERIVDTALALIADVGVDQLSMRQLSSELGASLGATYRHVPTKEALLLLCGRTLYLRSHRPREPGEEPLDWLRALVISLYEELARHPGMAAYVVQDNGVVSPAVAREVRASLLEVGHTAASSEMIGLVLTYYAAGALLADSERVLSSAGVPDPKAIIVAGFDFILRNYRPDAQDPADPARLLLRSRRRPPLGAVTKALAGQAAPDDAGPALPRRARARASRAAGISDVPDVSTAGPSDEGGSTPAVRKSPRPRKAAERKPATVRKPAASQQAGAAPEAVGVPTPAARPPAEPRKPTAKPPKPSAAREKPADSQGAARTAVRRPA